MHNVDITPKEGGSLSALTMWNGKAYSVCRSTGVVYEIVDVNKARQEKSSNDNEDERKVDAANENDSNENSNTNSNTITNNNHKYKNNSKKKAEEAFDVTADSDIRLVPRFILPDGDGYEQEGASAEWMTVKDGKLMVGSSGKEHTDQDNVILHYNECWVKTIDENGLVAHADWKSKYNSMRSATGTAHGAGYIVHETCRWSKLKQLWVFLPRRMACEAFDREKADYTGNNVMVAASEDFAKTRTRVMGAGRAWFKDSITGSISTKDEGSNIKHMGFSAFDFLPGSADEQIFTVKMDESHTRRKVTSVLAMYSTQGRLLMDEITIDNEKITGLVFL